MLIDLSRKPIIVQPEECPRHIVVRTLETPQTLASVNRRVEGTLRNVLVALTPGARLTRGRHTLMETRLHINYSYAFGQEPPEGPHILSDPYEIPTAYQDLLTNHQGSWRIQIQMQRRHTGTWLVTVCEVGQSPLLALAVKDLWIGDEESIEYPLARHRQAILEGSLEPKESAWVRLTSDD